MRVTPELVRHLSTLSRPEILILLAASTRSQWTTTRRELEGLAGLDERACQLALKSLERRGLLVRRWKGSPKSRRRFFVDVHTDLLDRCDTDLLDRCAPLRDAGARAADPDPSALASGPLFQQAGGLADPKAYRSEQTARPPVNERIRRELARLWPSLPAGAIARALERIASTAPTDEEVCAFARAARHALDTGNCVGAFERLHLANGTFGASFTLERFAPWLERRRAAARTAPPATSTSSAPSFTLEQAQEALRKVRST